MKRFGSLRSVGNAFIVLGFFELLATFFILWTAFPLRGSQRDTLLIFAIASIVGSVMSFGMGHGAKALALLAEVSQEQLAVLQRMQRTLQRQDRGQQIEDPAEQ